MLLPHISSATKESRIAMGERVFKNIDSYLRGKTPPDLIENRDRLTLTNLTVEYFFYFYFF